MANWIEGSHIGQARFNAYSKSDFAKTSLKPDLREYSV